MKKLISQIKISHQINSVEKLYSIYIIQRHVYINNL